MTIPIKNLLKNISKMISQTETYLPFIRFLINNVADGVYNLIIGSALSVFVNQFAMKMKYPSFYRFGKIALYRDQVDQFFK